MCRKGGGTPERALWGFINDDIERAHRLGKPRHDASRPRLLIVRFQRWSGKMLIGSKSLRDKLRTEVVRVANDLTRRQADCIQRAREKLYAEDGRSPQQS